MWGCRSDNFFASSHLLFVHLRYRHDDEGKHKHGEEEETTIDEYHSEKCIALQTKHFSRSATMSWIDRRWCGNFFSTLALAIRQSRALIRETDSLRGKSKIDRKNLLHSSTRTVYTQKTLPVHSPRHEMLRPYVDRFAYSTKGNNSRFNISLSTHNGARKSRSLSLIFNQHGKGRRLGSVASNGFGMRVGYWVTLMIAIRDAA